MNQTLKLFPNRRCLITRCFIIGLSAVISSQAAVNVVSSSSLDPMSNLYTYSYSVENLGPLELGLVSIPASAAAAVFGISPPAGFSLTFDPLFGFISLTEDQDIITEQTFAIGTVVAPFQFTSALAPGTVTFTAFDAGGNEFTGSVVAPIPEPSAIILTTLSLLTTFVRRR